MIYHNQVLVEIGNYQTSVSCKHKETYGVSIWLIWGLM